MNIGNKVQHERVQCQSDTSTKSYNNKLTNLSMYIVSIGYSDNEVKSQPYIECKRGTNTT